MHPTRLLVLGAAHLGRDDRPEPAEALRPIVERIASWRPDAIAIEALTGEQVEAFIRLRGAYDEFTLGGYPAAVACARAVDGKVDGTLMDLRLRGDDTSLPCRDRVMAWAAAGEPYTALLLTGGEPASVAGLPEDLTKALVALRDRGSEAWRVAGEAALALGLERLHPFDDHSHWSMFHGRDTEFDAMMAAGAELLPDYDFLRTVEEAGARARHDGDHWRLWRSLNTPEAGAASDELESGLWAQLADNPTHGRLARTHLAGWRTRNLLMAGHLRRVTGAVPGGRVLAVVGAAHKRPIEAALRDDQRDLEIVDVAELD